MCRRFSTAPLNVEDESTEGAMLHPEVDPASHIVVHARRSAPPQTDAYVGGDVKAASRQFELVPDGVPHGATSPVAF